MDYLLQKSYTQAPHRESRETGSGTLLGPDSCFECILGILSTLPHTEQVSSKMLSGFCLRGSSVARHCLACPAATTQARLANCTHPCQPELCFKGKPQVCGKRTWQPVGVVPQGVTLGPGGRPGAQVASPGRPRRGLGSGPRLLVVPAGHVQASLPFASCPLPEIQALKFQCRSFAH